MFFDSPGVVAWLLLALPIGMFAAQLLGGRFGLAGNLGIALAGCILGGLAAAAYRLDGQAGLIASILATAAGAVMATGIVRALPGRSRA